MKTPHCPYCTKEIVANELQCPSCGTMYGLETLLLIKSIVKNATLDCSHEHRSYDRIPKKIQIAYQTPRILEKHYLSNIGQGGVFIPTQNPLNRREKLRLRLILPDGGESLEVLCEVAWTRKEERATSKVTYPQGMGVKFINLSDQDRERIMKLLHHASA
jgi:type IV pilus assembly protein PilZ